MKTFFEDIAGMMRFKTMRADLMRGLRLSFTAATIAAGIVAGPTLTACAQGPALLAVSATSVAPVTVKFDRYPNLSKRSSAISRMVRDVWIKDPEYAEYVSMFTAAPEFSLGLADLNGDGTPEIFARHSDADDGYCDEKGICRLHIYSRSEHGLEEIGRMMSADPVTIGGPVNEGYKSLSMIGKDDKQRLFIWNGTSYRPK